MINATHFTYDGIYSGIYGLIIATFEPETVTNTPVFSTELQTWNTAKRGRFVYKGKRITEMLTRQFSIICEEPIPEMQRRNICAWLTDGDGFKPIKFHQPELEGYTYNCIFADIEEISVNGVCYGFLLTATFDSQYCYGCPTKAVLDSTKAIKDDDGYMELTVVNKSDLPKYVFPVITFDTTGAIFEPELDDEGQPIEESDDNKIQTAEIINLSDDTQRVFEFELHGFEKIIIDNELQMILNADLKTARVFGDRLLGFNKKWLRLKRGVNKLKVKINGALTIECPTYVLIGI